MARAMGEDIAARVEALAARGVVPTLAIVRVGDDEGNLAYERAARRRCEQLGIRTQISTFSRECTEDELLLAIRGINEDSHVHGALVLRPLPPHLDERHVSEALVAGKDVDGMTPGSLYGVVAGEPVGFPPCTAEAVMQLLRFYDVPLTGCRAVVIGRSLVVGRPVSLMLQAANATVTMCHTRTRNLEGICREAGLVVVATGHPGTFDAGCAAPGQVVVDVGTNWDEAAGKLVGDVDFAAVEPVVGAISPVPGGVGSVTTACLALHVTEAAERMGAAHDE